MKAQLAVAALMLGTIVQTCAAGEADGQGATIRYQTYNSINEVVFRVAEEKFCAKYKIKCEGVLIPSGPTGIQALLGNSIQIAFAAADAQIRAISNGAAIKMVSGFIDRLPYYVMVRSDVIRDDKIGTGLAAIKALKGKKVGVTARGAGVELTYDLLLRAAGLEPNDVTYVGVGGPPTAFGAFKSKQIDATILFQPMPGMCKYSGVCQTVLDLLAGEGGPTVNVLNGAATTVMAKTQWIEQNPKQLEAFVAAFQDAARWTGDPKNFDELRAIAKRYIKLDVPNADAIFDAGLREQMGNTDTRIKLSAVQAYIDVLHERGLIKTKLSTRDVVWSGTQAR